MIAKLVHNNVFYWCQGCKCAHSVPIDRWKFNDNLLSPHIRPSVRHYYIKPGTENEQITTCHYHITDGKIEYCNDCKHEFSGQTLPLQDIPEDYQIN